MSKNLHIVIPAAGTSTRFYRVGYYTHKPFLTIKYKGKIKFMLDHVLDSLNISPNILIHIGIPPGYGYFPYAYVNTQVNTQVIHRTESHVDTVSQLLRFVPDDDAVIFADCDVLISAMDFVNVCLALSALGRPTALVSDEINIIGRLSHIDSFPDFFNCNGTSSSPYALWSLRGYPNAGILKDWIRKKPSQSMDTYFGLDDLSSFAVKAVVTPVDWGTPDALLATGAEIV